VVVRAFDRAGNIREESIDVRAPVFLSSYIQQNKILITGIFLALVVVTLLLSYLVHHHIFRRLKNAFKKFKEDGEEQNNQINTPI